MNKALVDVQRSRLKLGVISILSNMFQSPVQVLERRTLASKSFIANVVEPLITAADPAKIRVGRSELGNHISKHFTERRRNELPAECRWMVERIEDSSKSQTDDKDAKKPVDGREWAFPSILARTGPQFPFKPWELRRLRELAGSLKGSELTNPIKVKSRIKKIQHDLLLEQAKSKEVEAFRWRAQDDTDHMKIDLVNPKFF